MRAIVDAGPLVAFLDRREKNHEWVAEQIEQVEGPLFVCEPVVTEAMFLLSRHPIAQDTLIGLLENGALEIALRIDEHVSVIRKLMRKYRDTPMSFADACIVRMAEVHGEHAVLTLDSDFLVYRKSAKQPLAVISPELS